MNGTPNVYSSLVRVGNDRMYFIGEDRYIHGYILDNGAWLTVSPSYAAEGNHGQSVGTQMKANSDLVASPIGDRLLYLGVDGRFYGFDILPDPWDYYYTGSFLSPGLIHRTVVVGTLIYPGDDRIYYVEVMADGTWRMHGFQKSSGTWQPVSPSYSAQYNFGQHVNSQLQVAGGLLYDKTPCQTG